MRKLCKEPPHLKKLISASIIALFVTACGSGNSSSNPVNDSPSADTDPPAEETTPPEEETEPPAEETESPAEEPAPVEETVELMIFNEQENPAWAAWDCCGGSDPVIEIDDEEHGATMMFSVGAEPAVLGFTARDIDGAVNGAPFDASAFAATGTLVFDLKMTASPGEVDWRLKLESDNAATAVEVSLTSSNEAHAAPLLNTWQTYSFDLEDFAEGGLDLALIDLVMVFPAFGMGDGAVYRIDNLRILSNGANPNGSQIDLPITFEEDDVDFTMLDFGGASTELGDDPDPSGNRGTVAITTKPLGSATYAGTTMSTDRGLASIVPVNPDNAANSIMKVWVFSPDAGIPIRLKLEDHNDVTHTVETETLNTVANAWEQITFDFNNEAPGTEPLIHPDWVFDKASIFFNFGTDGDTAGEKVYFWDGVTFGGESETVPTPPEEPVDPEPTEPVEPGPNGFQIDLPITFEEDDVDFTIIDFGGNFSVLGPDPDPAGTKGTVAITTKPPGAATWAGTTMSTNEGLASIVPVNPDNAANSIMKVWVFSPDAGIPIRLKLEDHNDVTHTVETETLNTVANAWEQITFDFNNEAPGTEPLIHPDWVFDKASIFFNFGTDGDTAGEKVYYWDEVTFGN